MENTYWNGNGKFQKLYNLLETKLLQNENGPDCVEGRMLNNLVGFYYRRYNDGDLTSSYSPAFNKGAKAMEKHGLPHVAIGRWTSDSRLEEIVDTVVEFLYNRLFKKQVTLVMQFAVTMEVPVNSGQFDIEDMTREMTLDVNCNTRKCNIVETTDILEIISRTEAPID